MTAPTPLDTAHAAMAAAPEDDRARLGFFHRLADTPLVMLLVAEPDAGAAPEPRVFRTGDGDFVLAFDGEARLADFAGGPAAYAALSGRQAVRALAGSGLGLGVNLGAPSETLLPPEALHWLAGMLDLAPQTLDTPPEALLPPGEVPPGLIGALDAKLAAAAGLARAAHLCRARYADGSVRHLLAFEAAAPGAEAPLAQAVNEALAFGGLDDLPLDIAFPGAGDPLLARVAPLAIRIELPQPPRTGSAPRPAPGSDPDRPPRLR